MNMNAGCDSVAQREPKATIIMDKMLSLEDLINRLCNIRDRIQHGHTGADAPVSQLSTGPSEHPSITSVLETGPELLQSHYNRMQDLMEQIESNLF